MKMQIYGNSISQSTVKNEHLDRYPRSDNCNFGNHAI